MMKFFALVALAMFATANATTAVTGGAITRGTTYLTGVDGGNLVITFTATNGLADNDIVTFTPLQNVGAYFSGTSPTCTATATSSVNVGITSIVPAADTGTGVLSVTVRGTVASGVEVVITCTDNLSVNAAAGAKTFTIKTTTDATVVTVDPGYTVTTVATGLVLTRGTTLLGGAAPGDLIITFTTAAELTTGKTITVTPNANLFTADAAVTCTATPNTITGIAGASVGAVLTLTVTGSIAATTQAVITCTSNLANNAAAGTALTVTMVTEADADTSTGTGYTTTSGVTAFTASRGTSVVTTLAPGTLVFGFTPTTALAHSATITLTSNVALYTASQQISCTATYADIGSTAVPTFVAGSTVSDATGKILTLVLDSTAGTDIFPISKAATITCTAANMAVNTAAGDVKFTVGTVNADNTGDVGPTVEETGYTITAGFKDFSATRASLVTGVAPGNLVVTLTPLILIGNSAANPAGTITLTPSEQFFDGNTAGGTATTCAVVITSGSGDEPAMTAAVTGHGTAQVLTLSMGSAATDTIAVDEVATITCTGNMDVVNGAAASVVTFGVKTSADTTGLTAQTGYTVDSATSAASSTASVGMLTMLALAGVAMRQ